MTMALYKDTGIQFEEVEGGQWASAKSIGDALGYSLGADEVLTLYRRHKDEFDADMSQVLPVKTSHGLQRKRMFSFRGVNLIVMLSKQPRASAIRGRMLEFLHGEGEGFNPDS